MDVHLDNWQARLARHFTEILSCRRVERPDQPVFALEHGLDLQEVQALATCVRAHVARWAPLRKHPLPWIVYAAEIGYGYSGDEYWQTFEKKTPGWTDRGDRYWIRECYQSFQKGYGGATPSGAWAKHFSIICWPITHAILPRDLQRQLARILYELRHSFSAELLETPPTLGEFIAARSWNATSRFQNLAQDTQLVGQIAAALLLEGRYGTGSLIHPAALQRIGADLDRERRAREWLRGARRFARERANVRGLSLGRGAKSGLIRRPEEARAEVAALGIEPRLVLRPTDPQRASWEVSLEIPDLSQLLFRFPRTRDILKGSRCVVAGTSGRPLARGRCLHGAQRVTLVRWPLADEVLLRFEQTEPQLEYLLRAECLLRPGPTWLFRIASDGLAYECRSLRVRPGERYIMVGTNRPIDANDRTRPIDLRCDGVHGTILDLPSALTADWEETLECLELGLAKTIEVWPAGLAAVVWDGEGHGEWLASERPCLAIRTDHSVASLLVSMGNISERSLELTSVVPGEPIFVELPQLPVGLHTVRISTRSSLAGEVEPLGDLDIVMRIREARPWLPGVSPHGPLLVQLDPSAPTLEQLWEGRVEVALRGPVGRRVVCKISLLDADTGVPRVTKRLEPMRLPVTPADWRSHFETHFRKTPRARRAYDTARACEIEFTAEELGAFSIQCEREFSPLRWAVRRSGQDQIARLLDDSGDTNSPTVARLSFETPCVEEPLEYAPAYIVPNTGGLFVARKGELTAAVIIPPPEPELGNLCCNPRTDEQIRSVDSVIRALAISRLWAQARVLGDLLSAIRQRDVLLALTRHVFLLVAGENWTKAEAAACNGTAGIAVLEQAVSRRREDAEIGAALRGQYVALAGATREERICAIAELAAKHLAIGRGAVCEEDPEWLSELALRLASDPGGVEVWAGRGFRVGIRRLLEELPTLARAARFLVVATDLHLESRAASREIYAGWECT